MDRIKRRDLYLEVAANFVDHSFPTPKTQDIVNSTVRPLLLLLSLLFISPPLLLLLLLLLMPSFPALADDAARPSPP